MWLKSIVNHITLYTSNHVIFVAKEVAVFSLDTTDFEITKLYNVYLSSFSRFPSCLSLPFQSES